jgi:hypothetical protein
MKNWINKNYKTIIVAAFLVPIITVAVVSISHVTMWYGLSNPFTWAIYLSIGIEIAALSALAAISADMGSKVYFPFSIVTLIQFIGNIFFAYTFIDVDSKMFKDWVDLVSPLVYYLGVEPTDFVGHKRFLALFAGGMLPVISLSFLHMLVKFTEEERKNRVESEPENEPIKIEASELVSEVSRVRLSEDDLKKLEEVLFNPPPPNEALMKAAEKYKEQKLKEILKREEELNLSQESTIKENIVETPDKETQKELIVQIIRNDEELGLYNEPFDNPLVKEPSVAPENASEMMITTNEDIIESIPADDEVSDWDVTLMDGLESEVANIFQEEPKEEEIPQIFSTITPESTNIFQEEYVPSLSDEEIMEMNQNEYERILDDEEFITDAINEFNQQSFEDELDELAPEPIPVPEETKEFEIPVQEGWDIPEEIVKNVEEEVEEVPEQIEINMPPTNSEELVEKKNS